MKLDPHERCVSQMQWQANGSILYWSVIERGRNHDGSLMWKMQEFLVLLKGISHKCHSSGLRISLVKIGEKDGMVTTVTVCEKCIE